MTDYERDVWQDWSSQDYRDFLDEFYKMQLDIAYKVANKVPPEAYYAVAMAVFGKIAPPAVYLRAEYDAWLKQKTVVKPIVDVLEKSKTPWRQSKNPSIEWCPEQEADINDVAKAKDKNVKETWYTSPREGYEHGAIFRKVKS